MDVCRQIAVPETRRENEKIIFRYMNSLDQFLKKSEILESKICGERRTR
jgi:hypothetical protein